MKNQHLKKLKDELRGVVLPYSPKEKKHLYSNLGIRFASYIAEQVSGKFFPELTEEIVLKLRYE